MKSAISTAACSRWIRTLAIVTMTMVTIGSAAPSQAQQYALDNSHTSLIFGVNHLGFSTVFGRFNTVEGQFQFNKSQPDQSQFSVSIDTTSLDTNSKQRDEHLSSPDFFDVKQFPKMTFVSKSITSKTDAEGKITLMVTGSMTLHGTTKEVTIPLQYNGEGTGPYGNYRCGFTTTFQIKRSEYGMKNMVPNIGDTIAVTFSFEGIQQK